MGVTLQQVYEVRELGVIGVGLGGAEHAFPPELYAVVYEHAHELGFHVTAHAGEAAGADSIWGAIRTLGAERIGHGTRAHEDPALLDFVNDHRIALELCVSSNVASGAIAMLIPPATIVRRTSSAATAATAMKVWFDAPSPASRNAPATIEIQRLRMIDRSWR